MQKMLLVTAMAFVCASLSAEVRPSTGACFTFDNLKFEILSPDDPVLGIVGFADAEAVNDLLIMPDKVEVTGSYSIAGTNLSFAGEKLPVVQINNCAFQGSKNLYFMQLPNSITDIGSQAFMSCEILDFDALPESLETIGDRAFYGCNAVRRISLPESMQKIGVEAFSYMSALEKINMLRTGITEIPEKAFYSTKNLSECYLPLGLTMIGNKAFCGTNSLKQIVFPKGLQLIGEYAFDGDAGAFYGLEGRIVLPEGLTTLGKGAFFNTPITVLEFGEGVTEIPAEAFWYCYELKSVKFPSTLKRIGSEAFRMCGRSREMQMTKISIPDGVTDIDAKAFYQSEILDLTIGDSVTHLPDGSCGIPGIITLGKGVKTIDVDAFSLNNLKLIHIKSDTPPTVSAPFRLTTEQAQRITLMVPDGTKSVYERHAQWRDFNIVGDTTLKNKSFWQKKSQKNSPA